jgi:hypothetical protein
MEENVRMLVRYALMSKKPNENRKRTPMKAIVLPGTANISSSSVL